MQPTLQEITRNYIRQTIESEREALLAKARAAYPNFDDMPRWGQVDCLQDVMDGPLSRLLKRNLAMAMHEAAYE